MTQERPAWQTPYSVWSWDLITIVVLLVLTAIILVWAWAYYPGWQTEISSFGVAFVVDTCLISYIAGVRGLLAHVRNRTPILQTAEVRFTVSQWGRAPLGALNYPIDVAALRQRGIPVPSDLKFKDGGSADSRDNQGRRELDTKPVPVYYAKLGGLLIEGFFLRPKDFFLIYFGDQVMTLGDTRSGVGYFCPRRVKAIRPKQIPESWLDGLTKTSDFKPGKSILLITGELSTAYIDWMRSNSEELSPFVTGVPVSKQWGWASPEYFQDQWLGAETDKHYLRGEIDMLRDENLHLRATNNLDARNRHATYERGADTPPNLRTSGDKPMDMTRA
ncbi:MAG: hypothetical protein KGI98_12055 [Euryarchaeota archaeon]|nr:hypothetical protein [Euryarchaeota archaeon]MDE1881203.1 hypothetical protein [Euryarchaeota archaeon]